MTTSQKKSAGNIIIITVLLSVAYSVFRYNILGPVPWKDLPFFISNKAISLAGFVLLSLNFTLGPIKNLGVNIPDDWLNARQALGISGFLLILIHALISFMLFNPEILPIFFQENETISLIGGVSMLGGILGFVVLWAYNLSFQTHMREDKAFIAFITSRRFLLIAMLFTMVHIFFMGYQGWMNPSGWHGNLPPISLVAFSIFVISYVINLVGRK